MNKKSKAIDKKVDKKEIVKQRLNLKKGQKDQVRTRKSVADKVSAILRV